VNDQKKLRKRILKEHGIEDCGDGWFVDNKNRIWHACKNTPAGGATKNAVFNIEGAKLVLPDGRCCYCLKEAPPGVIFYSKVS
jgi:hypothetical protein